MIESIATNGHSPFANTIKSGRIPETVAARLLVVDDTRAIHDDFRKILTRDNSSELDETEAALFGEVRKKSTGKRFELDSAFQGQEALALVKQAAQSGNRYSVAFVDVRMPPGWDGIETTRKLWEVDPDLQIVICTAYSDYSWDEMIAKMGNSDRLVILKKPFDTVEVLQLANALDEKWCLLQQTRKAMNELEQLVAQRTAHLETANRNLEMEIEQRVRREHFLTLQRDITQVLADSTTSSVEVASRILQIICEGMNWDAGELWAVDRNANVLRSTAVWHRPIPSLSHFKAITQTLEFSRDVGLPGRVWGRGEPVWVPDLSADQSFQRAEAAKNAGIKAGIAFPIRLQGEMLGVLGFYSHSIPEPERLVLDFFATMGSLIGQSLERKKLEEQLRHSQKMDAIGYLAGGVAHDFNNILTVILGYTQIISMKQNLDPGTLDGLRQITQAAQRATSLTGQLLTFSRKQVIRIAELNLNKVIANMARMLQRIIGEDISINFDYCTEAPLIEADEDSIGQVLMNLTVNARDAMPGGGKLEINTHLVTIGESDLLRHAEARPGEFVCLIVSDTGCGIAPENLPRIFEPFFTTKNVGQGTGLGLATIHGIVAQHQGWIEVISRTDVGTVFKIFLPKSTGVSKTAAARDSEMKLVGGSETILLVEDEAAVRCLAHKVLAKHGYRVIEAASGLQALPLWQKHSKEVDLLLTDIVMPEGISGRDLAHRLRFEQPNLNVLFTSGYDPDKAGLEAELREEVGFLSKPYSPQKLLEAVRNSLDARKVRTAP